MIIGERIKQMVRVSEFSAAQMAEKIGITNPYMYKIFKMESVDTKYLNKIAEILKVPVTDFFKEERLESNANPDAAFWNTPYQTVSRGWGQCLILLIT
jgi:transcriptional regulator with XRE-family HTH domain